MGTGEGWTRAALEEQPTKPDRIIRPNLEDVGYGG